MHTIVNRSVRRLYRRSVLCPLAAFCAFLCLAGHATAKPVKFDIPAQPAGDALITFSKQSGMDVLYAYQDLQAVRSTSVTGEYEPDQALALLLKGTGYTATQDSGKFVVARAKADATGSVKGSLTGDDGRGMPDVLVSIRETAQSTSTDKYGQYVFPKVAPGTYVLVASAPGYQTLHIVDVTVKAGQDLMLGKENMSKPLDELTKLDSIVVHADDVTELEKIEISDLRAKPFTDRNVDLPRGIDDVQAYFIISARDVERSGASSLENLLREKLPMSTAPNSSDQAVFIGGSTGNTINLRGLGTNQTLVLLNGRRMVAGNLAQNGVASYTDLNGISLGAIERIEVLPTSASAIYGSNAVGGVINIILKRNYTGGSLRLSYQNTFETDAPQRKADFNYGLSLEGGRTRVMLMAGYTDQATMLYKDRPFLKEYDYRAQLNSGADPVLSALPIFTSSSNLTLKPAYGGTALNANRTYVPVGASPTTDPLVVGAGLVANAGKFPDPFANPASAGGSNRGGSPLWEMTPKTEATSYGATVSRDMTSKLTLNLEYMHGDSATLRNSALLSGAFFLDPTSPANPFTTSVSLLMPTIRADRSSSSSITDRFVAGLTYKLPHEWTMQADYSWNQGTNSYLSVAPRQGTLFNDVNVLVDTRVSPIVIDRYGTMTTSFKGVGGTSEVALHAAGPVWRLPAGAPTLAIGLQSRQERYKDSELIVRQIDAAGVLQPFSRTTLSLGKKQTTHSAYAELQVPVIAKENKLPFVRELNLQLAGRTEDFKVQTGTDRITTFPVPATPPVIVKGTASYRSTNPTAGISYRPVKDVMFRVSYGKGFLAPTYSQLAPNNAPSTSLSTIVDPKRGNASYDVPTIGGGNPDLTPETSKTWNAGVVYQPQSGPLKGLRAAVDYSLIRKQNNIGSLSAAQLVLLESEYPGRVTRATPAPGDPFGVGAVTVVNTTSLNLLRSLYESIDVQLGYYRDTVNLGLFEFSASGTFPLTQSRKDSLTQPNLDYAGYTGVFGNGGPRFNGSATLTWDYRRWTASWTTRYVSKLLVDGATRSVVDTSLLRQGVGFVESQNYSDAYITYRFGNKDRAADAHSSNRYTRGLELQVGLVNVFNQVPPFDAASSGGGSNYSTWGNLRLREYRLAVKKSF